MFAFRSGVENKQHCLVLTQGALHSSLSTSLRRNAYHIHMCSCSRSVVAEFTTWSLLLLRRWVEVLKAAGSCAGGRCPGGWLTSIGWFRPAAARAFIVSVVVLCCCCLLCCWLVCSLGRCLVYLLAWSLFWFCLARLLLAQHKVNRAVIDIR